MRQLFGYIAPFRGKRTVCKELVGVELSADGSHHHHKLTCSLARSGSGNYDKRQAQIELALSATHGEEVRSKVE